MKTSLVMLTSLVVVIAGGATPPHGKLYPVKLDRLPPAGSVIEIRSRTEQVGEVKGPLAKWKRAGVTGSYKVVGSLLIRLTIDEVDDAGWATKANIKLVQCDVTSSDEGRTAKDLPGKTFQVSVRDGRREYLEPSAVNGGSFVLDEPRSSILDLALPLRFMRGEASLDAMFGTGMPQKAGATWESDSKALAEAFAHRGADPDRAHGTTTLRKVTANQLTVQSTVELSGLRYELPDGFDAVVEDRHQMRLSTVLPTDESAIPVEQSVQMSIAVVATRNGKRESEQLRERGTAKYKRIK